MTPLKASAKDRLASYLRRQKAFWNVPDEKTAKFKRVLTDEDLSETEWEAIALRDLDLLLKGIEPKADWTLLEIGCGVGRLLKPLRQRCPLGRLIGLDLSESMIGMAAKHLGDDRRISLLVNDGYSLAPVGDAAVDFAYSLDVLIHLFDAELILHYLREARRVLKPGGIFRFNVNRFSPDEAFSNSTGGKLAKWTYKLGLRAAGSHRWRRGEAAGFHGNSFRIPEIRRLIRKSGLSILEIRENPPYLWCTTRKTR